MSFSRKTSILLAGALTLSDAAFAIYSVPITRSTPRYSSLRNVTRKDRARITSFDTTSNLLGVVPIINEEVSYIVPVKVGDQTFRLVADTGSSNTWIGASAPYTPGASAVKEGKFATVSYGSGSFSGEQYSDTVSLGNLTARNQSISVARYSEGFDGTDGILGLGPEALTQGSVSGSRSLIPTVLQTLAEQHAIDQNVLGVYFQPLIGKNLNETNGELSFGGPDPSKYIGEILYTNISSNRLYSKYWGIDLDSVSYGGPKDTVLVQATSAIVDTGTTLTYIPSNALETFLDAANGTLDAKTTLPVFTTKPSSNLTFTVANTSFTLSPDQYLVPTEQYEAFQLDAGKYYAWLGDGGGLGAVNFIIGQKVLEHIYSVYDTTNNRVGLAYALPQGQTPEPAQSQAGNTTSGSSSFASSASSIKLGRDTLAILVSALYLLCLS